MQRESRWLEVAVAASVLVFAVAPLGRLLGSAILRSGHFDFAAVAATLTSRMALAATYNTIEVGVLSALGAMAIGTVVALALAVTNMRGKRMLALLFVGSLLVAPQVAALAFKTLAGPASSLLNALGLAPLPGTPNPMLGKWGIVWVLSLHHAPLAAVTIASGLRAIPSSLVEAAQLDGAPPWVILRRIVLPLLRPQFLAAGLLTFVAGAGNFGIPALLGIQANYLTLPTLIYRQLSSHGPAVLSDVAALSLLAALVASAGIILSYLLRSRDAVTLHAEERFRAFWMLGRWRPFVEITVAGVVGFAVILPAVSLFVTALVPAAGVVLSSSTATLAKFREILLVQDMTARAFRNSFAFAGITALTAALIAVLAAYVVERRMRRGQAIVLLAIQLPYAIPGVVLAIACILLLLRPLPLLGVSLYGTAWIILFAYIGRFLAVALGPIRAAMSLLHRDQEEAAAVFGASLGQRFRHVVLPTLLPSMAAAALLVFLMAFNELTVSALLWSAGTETLGVALLSLEDAGLVGEAAAVAVTASLFVAVIVALLDRVSAWLPEDTLPWTMLAASPALDSCRRT